MSVIIYNGVVLEDVLLENVNQEIEWDHHVGVDPLYIKTTISVEATLRTTDQKSDTCRHGVFAGDRLTGMGTIMRALMEPRKAFTYYLDSERTITFMDVTPTGAVVIPPSVSNPLFNTETDLNNGPKPSVKLKNIYGRGSAQILFTIELALSGCASAEKHDVVSLQYNCYDDIDEKWYTKRVFEGRVRVRDKRLNPHSFRNWALPPLQKGFRRTGHKYEQSQDGLELAFSFTDQEEYASPPFPAVKWSGDLITSAKVMASKWEQVIRLSLEGDKNTPMRDLAQVGLQVIAAKLNLKERIEGNKLFIQWSSIKETFHENRIDLSMSVWQAVGKDSHEMDGLKYGFASKDLGKFLNELEPPLLVGVREGQLTPGNPMASAATKYDRNKYRVPMISAGLATAFNQALHAFCTIPTGFPTDKPPKTSKPPKPTKPVEDDDETVDLMPGPLPPFKPKTSATNTANMYLDYDAAGETSDKSGVFRLPVAKLIGSGQDDTSKKITLFLPQCRRTLRIVGERLGRHPEMPFPMEFTDTKTSIKHTLISHKQEDEPPKLMMDGVTKSFRVRMILVYALSRAPRAEEKRRGLSLPYDSYLIGDDDTTVSPDSGDVPYYIEPTHPRAIV